MIMEIGTDSVIPDLTLIILNIGVTAAMTPAGIVPDHFIDLHIIAPHATEAQVHTATAMTHHITDPHPIEIFPKMTADINHANPTNNNTNQQKDLLQAHIQHLGKIKTEDTNRLQLTIHPQSTTAQMIRIVTREQFKLNGPSPTSHTCRGLLNKDTITIAYITDCPTVTVHAGKHYQALIDSGAATSLLQHSTYKRIEDCYKTPIQPMAAKLNTADGSPMMTLGSTSLQL